MEFIITNFSEMNRLWVRMQNQGAVRNRKRRERERQDLRMMVGTNLVRLSQLEGVDLGVFKATVLPRVVEQITNCKDKIAQQYLMECIVHAFPAEFHVRTLDTFLSTCTQLVPEVDVKSVMVELLSRLTDLAKNTPEGLPRDVNVYEVVARAAMQLIEERGESIPMLSLLEIQAALLELATAAYPSNLEYVDGVLLAAGNVLGRVKEGAALDEDTVELLVRLLKAPAEALGIRVLALANYTRVMGALPFEGQRSVALRILKSVLAARAPLDSPETTHRLLVYLAPLVKDESEARPAGAEEEDAAAKEAFEEEQRLMAKLVTYMGHEDTDVCFKIYVTARKVFGYGGTRRIAHTLVPLVFRSLLLVRRVRAREVAGEEPATASRKVFQFIHDTCTALASSHQEASLRLFLQTALAADACAFDPIA